MNRIGMMPLMLVGLLGHGMLLGQDVITLYEATDVTPTEFDLVGGFEIDLDTALLLYMNDPLSTVGTEPMFFDFDDDGLQDPVGFGDNFLTFCEGNFAVAAAAPCPDCNTKVNYSATIVCNNTGDACASQAVCKFCTTISVDCKNVPACPAGKACFQVIAPKVAPTFDKQPCPCAGDPAVCTVDATAKVTKVTAKGTVCKCLKLIKRADSNTDGSFGLIDPIFTLGALFVQGAPPHECETAADSNDDGVLDITDPIYSLNALFLAGSPPPPPFPDCGPDPTEDVLGCDSYDVCP